MSGFDRTPPTLNGLQVLFAPCELPELVFQPVIESCAWLYFDSLSCSEGWPLLRELARVHGDESVHVSCLEGDEPLLLTLSADSDEDAYHAQCEAELIWADVVRWWGASGQ